MPAFQYEALDSSGRTRTGVQEGADASTVREQLRGQGLIPTQVTPLTGRRGRNAGAGGPAGGRRERLAPGELAMLTRQLATLVRAGVPLEQALATTAQQSDRRGAKHIFTAVRARLSEGYSLAQALGAFPQVFPDFYRGTVAAGEQSGRLETVLEQIADYMENRRQLRQKMATALIYPAFVAVVALGVVAGLMVFVVPNVVQVFAGMDQELPLLTRLLIAVSDGLAAYGLWGLGALAAALLAGYGALRRPGLKRRLHGRLLRLPVLGRILATYNAARFARTFAIVAAAGVPALEGLQIAANSTGNLALRRAILGARDSVSEGQSIARALEEAAPLPPLVVNLIANGEGSGDLAGMLAKAAEALERELEATTQRFLAVLEPLLILLMGGLVLLIVVAILLPIFDMTTMV